VVMAVVAAATAAAAAAAATATPAVPEASPGGNRLDHTGTRQHRDTATPRSARHVDFSYSFASFFSRMRHALFAVSRSELSESLMRRTWLIISDGGLAGFDAEAPSLALTIDRGRPVY